MDAKTQPDPAALAIAAAMQELLPTAQIILNGSRAAGEHRPDSDVDLMAVYNDEEAKVLADEALPILLGQPRDGAPEVHVYTIVRADFEQLALMGQSFAGQAARHGVTPEGLPLDYRPEREPTPAEIREGAEFWRQMGLIELRQFRLASGDGSPFAWRLAPLRAQYAAQWAVKRLLYLANDPVRYRRDIAVMWRHIQDTHPLTAPERIEAVERLLAATATPDGKGCTLTGWVEAFRLHLALPVLPEEQWPGLRDTLEPAFRALADEADEREAAL